MKAMQNSKYKWLFLLCLVIIVPERGVLDIQDHTDVSQYEGFLIVLIYEWKCIVVVCIKLNETVTVADPVVKTLSLQLTTIVCM